MGIGGSARNIILERMILDELRQLIVHRESERVEFKEWRSSFSILGDGKFENRRHCLLGYCVALGNEGGGYVFIGVKNDGTIVGTSVVLPDDVKKQIYDRTGQKIEIEEIFDGKKRVFVVHIPSRPIGALLRFAGAPLMRIGDSLEIMSDAEQARILLEGRDDFSARICEASSIESIDRDALQKLRRLYEKKHSSNSAIAFVSNEQFLSDISLMVDGKLTYAGVILLAKSDFLDRNLADAEICFEYRNRADDGSYNDRVDYRIPFVLAYEAIWEKVASRQQVHAFVVGMLRREIPAFNEEVFREALFNAVCHRDYTQKGSIFIKQSPDGIEISNPGGFPIGVTKENIITVNSTPRNRLLAEVFQKVLPGAERSGQGADKIYRLTIEEGKGEPDYSKSETYFVRLSVPAVLKDARFVQYLENIINETQNILPLQDLLLLENIRIGNLEGITLRDVKHLLGNGFIELHGRTRGAKYILSKRYYSDIGKLGERTRRIGLSRQKCKELILGHIKRHGKGKMEEFEQIFSTEIQMGDLTRGDISNFLAELKVDGLITPERKGPGAMWVPIK